MIPALPYDIWSMIYILLPKEHRISLYPVNSTLFYLAMDERYSDLNAMKFSDEHISRSILNLSPVVARHVKMLALHPQLLQQYVTDVERRSTSIWRGVYRRSPQNKLKLRMASMRGQLLLDNIPNMIALSKLRIDCYLSDDVDLLIKSMRLIKATWIGPAWLSKLELQAPLDVFQGLVSSAPVFQNLQDLALTLTRGYLHVGKKEAEIRSFLTKVADFVNNKCNNASSLTIMFPYFPLSIDPFFAPLVHMPRLTCLSLALPTRFLKVDDLMSLHAFLSHHADNLCGLSLGFDPAYEGYYDPASTSALAHPIFSVPFPRLSTLTLQPVHCKIITKGLPQFLTSYLALFRPTLKHLHICSHVFPFGDLVIALGDLAGEGSALQLLKIDLRFLKCELFQYLSTNFTLLEELDVGFLYPREDDAASFLSFPVAGHSIFESDFLVHSATNHFSDRIQTQDYPTWGLRKLRLSCKALKFYPDNVLGDASEQFRIFKRSIAKALPSVVTFNGQNRAFFIGTTE